MHVLILGNGYPSIYQPLDGIFTRDQAEALAKKIEKVGLISISPISIKDFIKKKKLSLGSDYFNEKGVNTYVFRYLNPPKFSNYSIYKAKNKGIKLFVNYIKTHGIPNVIHVHCYQAGLLAIEIKRLYNIPFVLTEHSSNFLTGLVPHKHFLLINRILEYSSINIAVSINLKDRISEQFLNEFVYVPNIVDTDFFSPIINIPKDKKFTFFHAANLNRNKNQKDLILAFDSFLKYQSESQLIIAGMGDMIDELIELATSLNIINKVRFLGYLTRDEILYWYRVSNVFVLTSFNETFGVVLIEALSCGIPVVSTYSGGPSSIILNDELGELTEINSASIFLGMKKVYINFAKYNSENIRNFVIDNFSENIITNKLLDIYNRVV